jgi:hypothetical protein
MAAASWGVVPRFGRHADCATGQSRRIEMDVVAATRLGRATGESEGQYDQG